MSLSRPSIPSVPRYVDGIAVRRPTFYPDSGGEGWYPELQYPVQARLGVRFSNHTQKDVYVLLDEVVLVHVRSDMNKEDILYAFRDFGNDIRITFLKSYEFKPHLVVAGVQFPTPHLAEQAILFAIDNAHLFGGHSFRARYREVNSAGAMAGSTRDILLVREEFALTPPFTDSIFESHPAPTSPIPRPPLTPPPPLPPLDRNRDRERSSSSASSRARTPWNAVGYARDGFQGKRPSPSSDKHHRDRDGEHAHSYKKRRHDHDHSPNHKGDLKSTLKDREQGREREREREHQPSEVKKFRRSSRWDVSSSVSRKSRSSSPSQRPTDEKKEDCNVINLDPDSTPVAVISNSTDVITKLLTQQEKGISGFSSVDLEKLVKACEASIRPAASTPTSALPSSISVLDEDQSVSSSARDDKQNQNPKHDQNSTFHQGNDMPVQPMKLIDRISSQPSVRVQGDQRFFDNLKREAYRLSYEVDSDLKDNDGDTQDKRDSSSLSPSHSSSKHLMSGGDTTQVPVPIPNIPTVKDLEAFAPCFPWSLNGSGAESDREREISQSNAEPRWIAISNDGKQLIITSTEDQIGFQARSREEDERLMEQGEVVQQDAKVNFVGGSVKWAINELPTEVVKSLCLRQSWSFSHTKLEEKWKESNGRMVITLPQAHSQSETALDVEAGAKTGPEPVAEDDVEVVLS